MKPYDIFSDDPERVFEKVELNSPEAVEQFSQQIIELVFNGELSSTQGKALSSMLTAHRQIQLAVSVAGRLAAVEQVLGLPGDGSIGDRLKAAEKGSRVTDEVSAEDLETFEQRLAQFRARYGDE